MNKNKIICLDDPWLYDVELAEKLNLVMDRTTFRTTANDVIERGPHQIYALISYILTECCGYYIDRPRRVSDTEKTDIEASMANLAKCLCRIAGVPMYDRNTLELLYDKNSERLYRYEEEESETENDASANRNSNNISDSKISKCICGEIRDRSCAERAELNRGNYRGTIDLKAPNCFSID